MGRRTALLAILAVILLVALGQSVALHRAVLEVPAKDFEAATYLTSVDGWYVGYICGHHGAQLVRSRAAGSPPRAFDGPPEGLTVEMASLHTALPVKAVFEACLYFAVLAGGLLGLPFLARSLSRRRMRRPLRHVLVGSAAILLGGLLLSPYYIAGYGAGAFTNWVGPGACSSSGGWLWLSPYPGESVSYRNAIELNGYASLWLTYQVHGFFSPWNRSLTLHFIRALLPASIREWEPPWSPTFHLFLVLQWFVIGLTVSLAHRTPKGLTPACSGLATLAADARR